MKTEKLLNRNEEMILQFEKMWKIVIKNSSFSFGRKYKSFKKLESNQCQVEVLVLKKLAP
jgi:hypothetical protein